MRIRQLQTSWMHRDTFLDVSVEVGQKRCACRENLGWSGERLTHLGDKSHLRLIGWSSVQSRPESAMYGLGHSMALRSKAITSTVTLDELC